MKFKSILIALIALMGTFFASGQCRPSGGYYVSSTTFPIYYGTTNTVTNTGTDTFKMPLPCTPKTITFQFDFLKVSGTPGGSAVLYASANGGGTYDSVTAFTVTATSTTVPKSKIYIANTSTAGGNPYTNYMWVWTGTGTMVASWTGSVLIR